MASDRGTRDQLVDALYEDVGGSLQNTFDLIQVAARLGLSEADAWDCERMLADEGLIGSLSMGGTGMLTPRGIRYVEDLRQRQRLQAEAVLITVPELRAIESTLHELSTAGIVDALAGDDLAEFEAERQTVEIQIRSPRPKRAILKAALRRLADFATQAGAGIVAAKLTGLL